MRRAAIYCRLSDEDRDKSINDESESIQNQKSMLTAYAVSQGWQIQGIYCDEDFSGSDRTRPDFLRMLRACENGDADIVLCKTQSRFSRDIEVVEHFIHGKFPEWGVRFIGLVDNADTEIAGNKKQRQVNALINEWYLEDLSANIRKTLRHKNTEGKSTAPFPPYGYRSDPADKNHFIIDEEAADVVKSIFALYTDGYGYGKIAHVLNERGIDSPTAYKRHFSNYRNAKGEKSVSYGKWTSATICRIIGNETYIGNLVQHKTEKVSYRGNKRRTVPDPERIRCENTHEAIVTEQIWDEVSLLREKRTRSEKFSGSVNLFSGLVHCGECGSRMKKISYLSGKIRYNYYSCTMRGISFCKNSNIREDILSKEVLAELNRLIKENFDASLIKIGNIDKESLKRQLEETERKIALKALNAEKIYADRLSEVITVEQFIKFNALNLEGEKKLRSIAEEIRLQLAENREDTDLILKYRSFNSLSRRIVNEFIDCISVGSESEGIRTIVIRWKF